MWHFHELALVNSTLYEVNASWGSLILRKVMFYSYSVVILPSNLLEVPVIGRYLQYGIPSKISCKLLKPQQCMGVS